VPNFAIHILTTCIFLDRGGDRGRGRNRERERERGEVGEGEGTR